MNERRLRTITSMRDGVARAVGHDGLEVEVVDPGFTEHNEGLALGTNLFAVEQSDGTWMPIVWVERGFEGHRGTSVLRHNAPVTWNSTSFGRTHPHEKPLSLMRDIIGKCQQTWTILDSFMGSGSTGVACVSEGRNFIGVEMDERYFEIAVERIRRELVQERLF